MVGLLVWCLVVWCGLDDSSWFYGLGLRGAGWGWFLADWICCGHWFGGLVPVSVL